jgi:hypothetical protein
MYAGLESHKALVRARSIGKSEGHNEPFELTVLRFNRGFVCVLWVNTQLVASEGKDKGRENLCAIKH